MSLQKPLHFLLHIYFFTVTPVFISYASSQKNTHTTFKILLPSSITTSLHPSKLPIYVFRKHPLLIYLRQILLLSFSNARLKPLQPKFYTVKKSPRGITNPQLLSTTVYLLFSTRLDYHIK